MTSIEKSILKEVFDHPNESLSLEDLNDIAKNDRRSIRNLLAQRYIEEIPRDVMGRYPNSTYTVNYYRITERGVIEFSPWYEKIWFEFRGDIRTIIVSAKTALAVTLIEKL